MLVTTGSLVAKEVLLLCCKGNGAQAIRNRRPLCFYQPWSASTRAGPGGAAPRQCRVNHELFLFARVGQSPSGHKLPFLCGGARTPTQIYFHCPSNHGWISSGWRGCPLENVRWELKAFLNRLASLIVDGPPPIIRNHQGQVSQGGSPPPPHQMYRHQGLRTTVLLGMPLLEQW